MRILGQLQYLLLIMFLTMPSAFALAKGGGSDTGGGNLILRDGSFGLLDLYLFNHDAFIDKTPGIIPTHSNSFRTLGIDKLDNANERIFRTTVSQLEKWKSSSPMVFQIVQVAIQNLPLFYTPYKLNVADTSYYFPVADMIQPQELILGAIYMANLGVIVPASTFEKLSLKNQIALIIHESLRHAQVTYRWDLTNEYIERLTARILADPIGLDSLDKEGFVQGTPAENLTHLQNSEVEFKSNLEDLRAGLIAQGIREDSSIFQNFYTAPVAKTQATFSAALKDYSPVAPAAAAKDLGELQSYFHALMSELSALESSGQITPTAQLADSSIRIFVALDNLGVNNLGIQLESPRSADALMSLRLAGTNWGYLKQTIDDVDKKGWDGISVTDKIGSKELMGQFLKFGLLKP